MDTGTEGTHHPLDPRDTTEGTHHPLDPRDTTEGAHHPLDPRDTTEGAPPPHSMDTATEGTLPFAQVCAIKGTAHPLRTHAQSITAPPDVLLPPV